METLQVGTTFNKDIRIGLSSTPRYIPSKYFYDETGSRIFQKIMRMPEYYLTDCEYEIFSDYQAEISSLIGPRQGRFDLIELGAGDGMKTSLLISRLLQDSARFKYIPVDISVDALLGLVHKLRLDFPGLVISEVAGDYFDVLKNLNLCSECKKVSLFLGSTIGNFTREETIDFFRHLSSVLNSGDMILTGFDLVKDPGIIISAYDDPHGYTRDFNLNLLKRMNEELDANFSPTQFFHFPCYDPSDHTARSYLVSNCDQDIFVGAIDQSFHFRKWESILTEISHKFTPEEIQHLAHITGFKSLRNFTDKKGWFVNALWEKV